MKVHVLEQAVGAAFAVAAIVISFHHIIDHCRRNTTVLRNCTLRILVMVPLYAVCCLLALFMEASDKQWSDLLRLPRELWEAVALWSFVQLMLWHLDGPEALAEMLEEKAEHDEDMEFLQHPLPLRWCWCLCPPYRRGMHFVKRVMCGFLQYIVIVILYAAVEVVVWSLEQQSPGSSRLAFLHNLKTVAIVVKSLSAMYCMYHLGVFYLELKPKAEPKEQKTEATEDSDRAKRKNTQFLKQQPKSDLRYVNNLYGKFLCIKGVVFFTFWQTMVINVFVAFNIVPKNGHDTSCGPMTCEWSQKEIADGISNLLLCVEMAVFSLMHKRYYTVADVQRQARWMRVERPTDDSDSDEAPPVLKETFGVLCQCEHVDFMYSVEASDSTE